MDRPGPRGIQGRDGRGRRRGSRQVVYVGDRLYDDIWGAQNAGLKAIHVPHSLIPAEQVGHPEGTPDAVAHGLADIPGLLKQL